MFPLTFQEAPRIAYQDDMGLLSRWSICTSDRVYMGQTANLGYDTYEMSMSLAIPTTTKKRTILRTREMIHNNGK